MESPAIKILVAEKNDLTRYIIEKMLAKRGYAPVCVSNFDAAIYELQRHSFAMAIFDFRIAEVQDETFLPEFSSALSNMGIRTIVLTDGSFSSIQFDWQKMGFDDKVEKPVRFDCLDRLINTHLIGESELSLVPAK